MTHGKEIVLALMRIGIAGNIVEMFLIEICVFSAGQHLVGIALVGNVKNDLILRGIKHIVQCDGRLHHAEVRPEVTAVLAQTEHQSLAHFSRQRIHLVLIQFLHIFRCIDFFQIHGFPPNRFHSSGNICPR